MLKIQKIMVYFSFLFIPYQTWAQVQFKWLGVSGFTITDQKTTLVFDPAMTRIPVWDYLPWRKIQSDHNEVDFWFNRCGIKKVDGTFINHAHTDHAIDAPYVTQKYGATLYGSSSVYNLGLGHGVSKEKLHLLKAGEVIKIGDFTITPYLTPHAPHFLNVMLMDGHINSPLKSPASAWDYQVGDTFSFLITHPQIKILFQAIGRVEKNDPLQGVQVDVLILTIANRISSENLIQGRVLPTNAKTLIPVHYDNFFVSMRRDAIPDVLWGVNPEDFKTQTQALAPAVKSYWPKYCEALGLTQQ